MKKMYHVSLKTINKKEVLFTPRVPVHICEDENQDIPRICVCPTIREALNVTPYKSILVNDMRNLPDRFVTVYEFNVPDEYLWDNEKVRRYVPDAYLTNEHWIIKPMVAKVNIINIKYITLKEYFSYANFFRGLIKDLEYENISLEGDKVYNSIFLAKSSLKYAKKIANKIGATIEVSNKGKNPLYTYEMGEIISETDRAYNWFETKIKIPSNKDATELINILNKENKKYSRLGGIPFK